MLGLIGNAAFAADREQTTAPVALTELPPEAMLARPDYLMDRSSSAVVPLSMLPLATEQKSLDLSRKTTEQLKSISVAEMMTLMGISLRPGEKIAWGYWIEEFEYSSGYSYLRRIDQDSKYFGSGYSPDLFRVVTLNDTVDMRSDYGSTYHFAFIVGTGQLDSNARRYSVTATVADVPRYFGASVYTDASPRARVFPIPAYADENRSYGSEGTDGIINVYLQIPTNFPLTQEYYFALYEETTLNVKAYEGHIELGGIATAKEAEGLWSDKAATAGGYKTRLGTYSEPAKFTLVFSNGDIPVAVRKISVMANPMNASIDFLNWRNPSDGRENWNTVYNTDFVLPNYTLNQTNNVLKFRAISASTGAVTNSLITSVRIDGTDITSQAVGNGYTITNLATSKTVTVVSGGITYTIAIPAVVSLDDSMSGYVRIGSSDTNFNVTGADSLSYGNTYVVPYQHDTYYYNGYQTVLSTESANLGNLAPLFYVNDNEGVRAYSGGQRQTSGFSTQNFSTGPVQYTAVAPNNEDIANYQVSFDTRKSGGPSLFVNGPDERYIAFDDYYGIKHDIFIANLGDAPLRVTSVRLVDARNIKLDEWYTLEDGATIPAFTTANSEYNGEIPSVAKIRLLSTGGSGVISGKLEITTNGGTKTIVLSGRAGNPQINTEQAQLDAYYAVRFVPFSFLVTTDNQYRWSKTTFNLVSGNLPEGLALRPTGEIYGIPTTTGTYTFTVEARFAGGQTFPNVRKQFTITVLSNTDTNVNRTIDDGYSILTRIPSLLMTAEDQLFELEGVIAEFKELYINGQKMELNTDYIAEEGSTRITVRAQTIRNTGAGTNTIAAEFRLEGDDANQMKRAAQNYTYGTSVVDIYDDIIAGAWYVDYVQWAFNNEFMTGTGAKTFAPHSPTTQATIVTVLARLADVQLGNFNDVVDAGIPSGQWYTNAARWAKSVGLFSGTFTPDAALPRSGMAVMLQKFVEIVGIDTSAADTDVEFTDAGSMDAATLQAFTILYGIGVFEGNGKLDMNPAGRTTRAELSTLLYRLSSIIENNG